MNRPVNSKLKFPNNRTEPAHNAVKRKKCLLLWAVLGLLLFIPACLLTSLGQNLLTIGNPTAKNTARKYLINNPVFSPLARSSRSSNTSFFPGAHIIYNGDTMSAPNISWIGQSNAGWWLTKNEDSVIETDSIPEEFDPAFSDRQVYRDLRPKLRRKVEHPSVSNQESVSPAGIADLLEFLREKDRKHQSEQEKGASKANPFEEALKVARETAPEKSPEAKESELMQANNEETAESKPAAEEADAEPATNDSEDISKTELFAGPLQGARTFLFIGAFNNQLVSTDIGTSSLNRFNQSAGGAIAFDLKGAGEKAFDLNIILRNRANQEAVASGDLNLDGFVDMIVTNKTTNRALIYLNDEQGNFTPIAEIDGNGPAAAVINDFNQDELPDIAVLFETSKAIVVAGKGYRQFVLPYSPIYDEYSSMIPYDFDNDGLKDLLLTNYNNLTAAVYTNCGAGQFSASGSFPLESFPMIQSSVDLDGDWFQDLVYVQYLGDRISIVIQNGRNGRIHSLGNVILDPSLYYAVGDFNQDGVVDIAIANPR